MIFSPLTTPGPEPEKGSEDWLWFKPDTTPSRFKEPGCRRMHCAKCDVYWEQQPVNERFRCFCCGRFVKRGY